jgi:hypothetical protein
MLNSLLHLRQLVSARNELWGEGAGPLRRGIPVVLRSAMEMGEVKLYASAVARRHFA